MYKTPIPKAQVEDKNRAWYVIDVKDQVLGRISTKVANILRGKNKAYFSPHVDCGDNVIIINSKDIKVTGNKLNSKIYHTHSGYVGGLKSRSLGEQMEIKPEFVLYNAIKGMIPKNKLRTKIIQKLYVYADDNHRHEAQKPKLITL